MSKAHFFRDAPIKRRLRLIALLSLSLAFFAIIILLTARAWIDGRSRMVDELSAHAGIVGTNAAPALLFDDRKSAAEILAALQAIPDIVYAAIYDKNGQLFAVYQPSEHGLSQLPPSAGTYRFTSISLALAEKIVFKGEDLGVIYLQSSLDKLYFEIIHDSVITAIAAFIAIGLASFLLTRLQKGIEIPIRDLASVMQTVSREQNYAVRTPFQRGDEVGALAQVFNEMLERIQQRDQELARHRSHLEEIVSQRTAELKQSNLRLEQELAVSARAQAEIQRLNEELEAKVQERTRQLLETQDELVRKEKLAVLGQVAGSVGHELRNPLGVMSNAVYFLKMVLTDADETVHEYLDIIVKEIAGSERIVSDLLDSVRTKPPQPLRMGVRELIGETLKKCVIPQGVIVRLHVPDRLPPIRVDPQQMQQVFHNLIANGVDAMPEGGDLEIMAEQDEAAGRVRISVLDSGIGIAPEHLGRLFQPLFTTKARGIGLGLVVVKNLTQANGGAVEVQSEWGKGTKFTVSLPAEPLAGVA
ncbi:MAG: ATP-binding protein [Methylococcaceae bacterium]|nr:ATP-binding protein [Methylococcaceae bacterium]